MRTDDRVTAAGVGRSRLRASDSDRERVLDILKAAFVQGRLTKDELDARVGQTLASRTWGDLTAITADIPPWPLPRPVRKRLLAVGRADREWHILVSDRYYLSVTRLRICGMVELATGG